LSRAPNAAIGLCCKAAVWRNPLRCSAPSLCPQPFAARPTPPLDPQAG
jgi:hypothetical protein